MNGLVSQVLPYTGLGSGAAAAAVVRKKIKGQATPKRHFMVVPYGHVAYKTMFGNPVYYRFGSRKGQLVIRRAGEWRRIPFLERLACIDERPQRHELPPQEVIFADGVSFTVTPILSYQVEDGFAALFGVEDWHRYLVEGCEVTVTSETSKMKHGEFLNSEQLIEKITSLAAEKATACGIKVHQLAFKDRKPDSVAAYVITREPMGEASARGVNALAEGMDEQARELDPLLAVGLVGTGMLLGAQGHSDSQIDGASGANAPAEVLALPGQDAAAA